MENLTNLHLTEQDDWHFKIKCTQCNETAENVIYFNLVETQKVEGSRGEAHFIQKCKLCEKHGYIEYCPNSIKKYTKSEEFQTIAMFECRNLEILEFVAGNQMKANGTENDGDTEFDDIDLANEPDWAGYDEKGDCSVGVYEFKSKVVRS